MPRPPERSPDPARAPVPRTTGERDAHMDLIERIAGIGSWEIDLVTDRIFWSRELCRIHGVTPETAPHTHEQFRGMVHPDDLPFVDEGMSALVPGEPATAEFRVIRPDGAVRLLQAHALLVADDEGRYTRVLGTSLDITERRATEQALRASENAYRSLFRYAFDAMWVHDIETGELLELNEAAVELYGYTAEEQKVRGLAGLTAADQGFTEERAWEYARRAAAGEPQRFEWMGYHKSGTPIWEEMRLTRINIGGKERLVAAARDISARKEAELAQRRANEELERRVAERTAALATEVAERTAAQEALRRQDEHFRRIIENAADFVMTCDITGALTYVAPSSMRILGFRPEELLGTRPSDLLHADDVARIMLDLQWVFAHPGEPITTTFRIRHRDGSYRVFENVGRTISNTSADDGVIAFGRDVTDRVRADEALARAKEEAERANRAKSEFLSRMSHELRTPLNSILGFAQLATRAEMSPQQAKGIHHILKAGRHLLQLINEVLEISRIEAGRERFSLEPVALAAVLHETIGLVRPLAQQHQVQLHEGTVPDGAFVHADRQRLVQVILNLLSNAIKYNRPNGVVQLECGPVEEGGWAIRVRDTGRGIPDDQLHQLFTPFARLGAEQTEVEGTGLGLALSQRLCEAMGGELTLESTSDEGSTFRVELDGARDPVRGFEDTGTYPVPAAGQDVATLLYIEDNLANLTLVEAILQARPGWRTLPALQGQLGVELAREHVPDVVLLDLHLPDIAGEEVLRRLRSDPRTAGIPVVVVSADATRASLERLRAAGASAYLTKPLDVGEFLEVVDRFLPGGQG